MRNMSNYEVQGRTAENICFVGTYGLTNRAKQIFEGAFWQKSLINAHIPHTLVSCLTRKAENMRIMRIYEGR